jgi:hypothetical protein
MTGLWIAVAVAVVLLVGGLLLGFSRRLLNRDRRVAQAVIADPADCTSVDRSGAVRTVQGADLYLPRQALDEIWTPMHLERLARTYWRFLTRVTLGLIRVVYTERERFVVLLVRPLKLLTFQAPEYQMDAQHGVVRWRIERGLLVARRGRGAGYLQIDVRRCSSEDEDPERARLHVDVEVANFYPAIASGISRWIYNATQSRIHVIVTHGFLRSLARLDLAESRVGRYATLTELPDPPAPSNRFRRSSVDRASSDPAQDADAGDPPDSERRPDQLAARR